MAAQKILRQGQGERRHSGPCESLDDSRHFWATSKQSWQGLLQQSGPYLRTCHNNPCTPLKVPRQALLASPPHQANTKPFSQPQLLPWPVELLP